MEANTKLGIDAKGVDQVFFTALSEADGEALQSLLTDDFVLIDVMRGGEVSKAMLLAAIGAGQIRFDSIEAREARVRQYHATAIVTGRTEIRGWFGGAPFETRSRYTHVFVEENGRLRLASAQGTQIIEA